MYTYRPLVEDDREPFLAHFHRTIDASGNGQPHAGPFIPGDEDRPQGIDFDTLEIPVTEKGWQRWWIAEHAEAGIIGHVDLKGPKLKTQLHRCLLGINVEDGHRDVGVGRRLMDVAIAFARAEPTIDYVDLSVFGNNDRARHLYRSLGFVEQGEIPDKFRILDEVITDVNMALDLRES